MVNRLYGTAFWVNKTHGRRIVLEQQPVVCLAAGQVFVGHGPIDGVADASNQCMTVDVALGEVVRRPKFYRPGIELSIALAGE